MLRAGLGPIAAGLAAFAIGFISYLWLTPDTEWANAGSRADARTSASSTIHPGDRGQLASHQTGTVAESTFEETDNRSAPQVRAVFAERFSFDQASPPNASLQRSHLLASFDDRYVDNIVPPGAAISSGPIALPAAAPRVAAATIPLPRPAPKRPSESGFQLASASDTPVSLAYAPSDPAKSSTIPGSPLLKNVTPTDSDQPADVDTSRTAIYDITSRTVYLPNGRRLEAHSGLGGHMDDPRYVHVKRTGPTPPNVYQLKLRERPFHGVRAIRLIPTDSSKMYGRDGILAHTYLLGPKGESNGCVSLKDYAAFLDAFDRGEINRLVVVERLADPPSPKTASDWFANALKDIFRRS